MIGLLNGIELLALNSAIWDRLWFSTWESLATIALALVVGGGLALYERRHSVRAPVWFVVLVTLPVFLPTLVVAFGFISVWGNGGYINNLLAELHIPTVTWLYSPVAILASHAFYNIPLAYLAIRLRLLNLDVHLEDAAKVLGAKRWQVFFTITWPRLRSTVLGISAIIGLYAFTSFGLPLILGGVRYQTLEVFIYQQIVQYQNPTAAISAAIMQFILLSLVIGISFRSVTSIQEQRLRIALPRPILHIPFTILAIYITLGIFILMPLLGVITDAILAGTLVKLWSTGFWPAWLRSLWLTAIMIFGSGLVIFLALQFMPLTWRKYIVVLLAISPITLSLILRLTFNQSLLVLLVALIILFLPLGVYILATRWDSRPARFEETLQLLGANRWQQFGARLRWLRPAWLYYLAFATAFSFGDIALASVLAPYNSPTAMSFSYNLIGSYRFGMASAGFATLLLTIGLITGGLYYYLHHHET